MAARKKVGNKLKEKLISEAGGKCANPGCPNLRTQFHHIKRWAAYRSHDPAHMIAVCPSCHEEIHHGRLKITDETAYRWKSIRRAQERDAFVYVEPAKELKLIAGTIYFSTTNESAKIFELPNGNSLSLRLLEKKLLQVSCRLHDTEGREVLRVVENHVSPQTDRSLEFLSRPGRALLTVANDGRIVSDWIVQQALEQNGGYASDSRIILFDIEVEAPGQIRIQGCWPDREVAVLITRQSFSIHRRLKTPTPMKNPVPTFGETGGSIPGLVYSGPPDKALFLI